MSALVTSQSLIDRYLEFFRARGHAIIPGASLVPEHDPTVLFTTAGMHPLVPYLLGNPHPQGKRLANVQPCVRTGDMDAIGDATHLTFFEMLGNWSLGDYFKRDAIAWSWEFLTGSKWLTLPPNRLAVSIFAGDQDAPRDDASRKIWQELGVPAARIAALPKADNWWGPAGQTGPCGPDTEIFYWVDRKPPPVRFDPRDPRWVEIWNDVFMEYRKTETGGFEPLAQKNVDTGMGVERTVAALNGYATVYETDTFASARAKIQRAATRQDVRAERIIADHLRAATILLADPAGLVPSNTERGYVVRRLIRRAIRFAQQIGLPSSLARDLMDGFIQPYAVRYPWVGENVARVHEQFRLEAERFAATISAGMKVLERRMKISSRDRRLSGKEAFDLLQTYGFPLELTQDVAREQGWNVDTEGFTRAFVRHQELSRTATAGRFRSGLADTSAASTRLHTATHLLHAALRHVLGSHVRQKGSNITPERLRFDFSHGSKVSAAQLKEIEALVNRQIQRALVVKREEMSPGEAKRRGALGFFGHKYAERISVYSVGDFSQEICTGPHVENTRELGSFHILKEEPCGAGVRRIKAVVEPPAGSATGSTDMA